MRQGPQQQVASNVLAVMCLFLSHVTPPDPFCLSAQEIFVVMTDSFHKPGFKLHAHILHHLFSALDAGACCLPDGSSFLKCAAQHPFLWEGRRSFICWPQPWPQAPACCQVCLSEGEGWVEWTWSHHSSVCLLARALLILCSALFVEIIHSVCCDATMQSALLSAINQTLPLSERSLLSLFAFQASSRRPCGTWPQRVLPPTRPTLPSCASM